MLRLAALGSCGSTMALAHLVMRAAVIQSLVRGLLRRELLGKLCSKVVRRAWGCREAHL
jgi:hypothetical protein